MGAVMFLMLHTNPIHWGELTINGSMFGINIKVIGGLFPNIEHQNHSLSRANYQ